MTSKPGDRLEGQLAGFQLALVPHAHSDQSVAARRLLTAVHEFLRQQHWSMMVGANAGAIYIALRIVGSLAHVRRPSEAWARTSSETGRQN